MSSCDYFRLKWKQILKLKMILMKPEASVSEMKFCAYIQINSIWNVMSWKYCVNWFFSMQIQDSKVYFSMSIIMYFE